MAKRDRRDNPPKRDSGRGRDDINEVERESLTAVEGILGKVAGLLKPLGLSPDESTKLVEEMYESVLEVDRKNAGEPDDLRRRAPSLFLGDCLCGLSWPSELLFAGCD